MQIPQTLNFWRDPGSNIDNEENEEIWTLLDAFLREKGLQQWTHWGLSYLVAPKEVHRKASGFAYAEPSREIEKGTCGGIREIMSMQCTVGNISSC